MRSVWVLFIGMLLLFASTTARAVLKIEITQGAESAVPVAIIPFAWNETIKNEADIAAIIASDLHRSGQFEPVADKDLPARPVNTATPDFNTWRIARIDHLVIGEVRPLSAGNYEVRFRLFDVFKGEQVLGYSFSATPATLRAVAHKISDYIYEHITGVKGPFSTYIAYVTSEKAKNKNIQYKLQVADTDGYNPKVLLSSSEPIMSPAWSPDGKWLSYVSFENNRSEVYLHDRATGKREVLSSRKGLNGAPVWSPDGRSMALTLSKDGNSEIYVLSLRNKQIRRLTYHWSIDTEPAWMPDGQSIVFTSSRSGKPQLYRVDLSPGEKPRRLTFEGNYNTNADISADGKSIVFVHGNKGKFHIAVLQPDSGFLQILTEGPLDESPSFAPNGAMVLYASQHNGLAVLAAVSTDGRSKQRLVLSEGDVREPVWAPLIQ